MSLDPLPSADVRDRFIGRYRILGPLGRGGMGLVYRAEDPRLGRHVALKLLPEHLSHDAAAKERLMVEARAASALDHPNICTVYEIGETDDGRLFIAMACYEGQTLAERLKGGPLPVEEAVELARQIARGLGAAHRKGIVHRDLKPSNVFLCEGEEAAQVKILDFGVAKVQGLALTKPGATLGTVEYAAPEQAQGRVDARSDLWALGVVLYEMLAGRRPFEGAYEAALLYAILNLDPAPVREHRPEVPEAVEAVVVRLLEKDPAARFQTAEALVGALDGEKPAPAKHRRPRHHAMLWSVSGVVALVALMLALWLGTRERSVADFPDEMGIAVLPFQVLGGGNTDSSVSPDGLVEMIASELTQLERYQNALWVASTSEVRAQSIEGPTEAGRALGVSLAVTGSVEQDSAGVLLRLNLEDAESGQRLDAKTLDVSLSDLDMLQASVFSALAQMLDIELQPEAREALAARATRNADAFAAYVRGIGLLEGDSTPEVEVLD